MKLFTCPSQILLTLAFSSIFFACSTDKNTGNYSATITPKATHPTISNEDMKFIFEAENLGIYNTHVAREALIRSTISETSSIAQEMIESSRRMSQAISKVAVQYNLSLPTDITEEQKSAWRSLVKQKGWNFDKKFAAVTEETTGKFADVYTHALGTCKDERVKAIAQQGLAELTKRQNLLFAQQEKMKQRIGDTDSSFTDTKVTASLDNKKPKK